MTWECTPGADGTACTASGSGAIVDSVDLPAGSLDAAFDINGLDQKTNGPGADRYVELVTVWFTDGAGNTQLYGRFSGADAAAAAVG